MKRRYRRFEELNKQLWSYKVYIDINDLRSRIDCVDEIVKQGLNEKVFHLDDKGIYICNSSINVNAYNQEQEVNVKPIYIEGRGFIYSFLILEIEKG